MSDTSARDYFRIQLAAGGMPVETIEASGPVDDGIDPAAYADDSLGFFRAKVDAFEARVVQPTKAPEPTDPDAWAADISLPVPGWIAAMSPEELERTQHDGAFAQAMYERFEQTRPSAQPSPAAITATQPEVPSDSAVEGFLAGALAWSQLSQDERDVVLDRHVDGLHGRPTPAVAAVEAGAASVEDLPMPEEYFLARNRQFARSGAEARFRRGQR